MMDDGEVHWVARVCSRGKQPRMGGKQAEVGGGYMGGMRSQRETGTNCTFEA